MTNTTKLLISCADPLFMCVRILNYKRVLSKYFSNFIIGVASGYSDAEKNNIELISEYFDFLRDGDDNIKFNHVNSPESSNHGMMISYLIKNFYNEIDDNILLMEDDDFIISPYILEYHINNLNYNGYDFVGEPRGCSNNNEFILFERQIIKEDDIFIASSPNCDECLYHFWPTHFLTKKQFIKENDTFCSYGWVKGDEIKLRGRNFKFEYESCGDTFVKFSIDLLERVNRGCVYSPYFCQNMDKFNSKFDFYFQYGIIGDEQFKKDLTLKNIKSRIARQPIYHLGSGSFARKYHLENPNIINETSPMVENLLNGENYGAFLEFYRRYRIYKIIFDVVKDEKEMEMFRDGYIKNFKLLDEYYESINVQHKLDVEGQKYFPKEYYEETFKQIIGK